MVVVSAMNEPCTTIAMGADAMPFSRIVFGMWRIADWQLSRGERRARVEAALELGVTSFDHADIYGDYAAESLFGDVLADAPQLRERMQLVTKCGIRALSARRPEHRVKHYDTGPCTSSRRSSSRCARCAPTGSICCCCIVRIR